MLSKWDDFKARRLEFFKSYISLKKQERRVEKYFPFLKIKKYFENIKEKMVIVRRRKLLCRMLIFFIVRQKISFIKMPFELRMKNYSRQSIVFKANIFKNQTSLNAKTIIQSIFNGIL
jgi:hypothetical protein